MEADPELWLKKHASWNQKKTIAKTTVFQVPIDLLVKHRDSKINGSIDGERVESESVFRAPILNVDRGLTCAACKLQFPSIAEQHAHFKSDLHRCNLQRSVKNQVALTEEEFASMKDTGPSSRADNLLLDSDDSSSDSDSGSDDNQTVEIDEDASVMTSGESNYFTNEEGTIVKEYSKAYGPQFLFQRHSSPWRYAISLGAFQVNSLFYDKSWHKAQENPWTALSDQLYRLKSNMSSCVFLLRSGRFAGAVIENGKILVHKVLRRYTVRAKAGGGQSSHDNKSDKARSAGAMLRRYGEQALKEDIQSLLTLWSTHIQCCHMVYISAPKTMRSVFFDPAKDFTSPLTREDTARISYIPFMTDKPTLEEIKLAYTRCTSVVFMKESGGSGEGSSNVRDATTASAAAAGESSMNEQLNLLLKEDVKQEMSERKLQKQRRKQAKQQQQQEKEKAVLTVEGHLVEDGFTGLGNRLVECPPSFALMSTGWYGRNESLKPLAERMMRVRLNRWAIAKAEIIPPILSPIPPFRKFFSWYVNTRYRSPGFSNFR